MMRLIILIKMNFKLLLRNKGFICILGIIPLLSVFVLNIRQENLENYDDNATQVIHELDEVDTKVVYSVDMTRYTVKVYDSSNSDLTDYLLQKLIDTGMFSICRYHSEDMTKEEIEIQTSLDANNDRIGTILYVKENFEQEALNGEFNDSITMYTSLEDERGQLFERSFEENLTSLFRYAKYADGDKAQLTETLKSVDQVLPEKIVQQIGDQGEISLTSQQKTYTQQIGFSYAIVFLGFLFSGIFIAYSIIEERANKVYIRINLTKTSRYEYMVSKLAVSVLVSLLQTVIIGIGLYFFVQPDFGIGRLSYLYFIFMLGLIFNTLSLSVGVIIGNVMGANYAVFSIWSISGLLSGLYFSIDHVSGLFKGLSNLMPQSWLLRGTKMLITGDHSAYFLIARVTAAFLIVILSIGAAGLKLKHED